jgi:hypothetical protein
MTRLKAFSKMMHPRIALPSTILDEKQNDGRKMGTVYSSPVLRYSGRMRINRWTFAQWQARPSTQRSGFREAF